MPYDPNRYELNLLENAIDFLLEGIANFVDGHNNEERFKFAVLNIYQGVELVLKQRLANEHPMLIYRDLNREINDSSITIGFEEAIARLKNANVVLSEDWVRICRDVQKWRNNIQHHKCNLDISETSSLLGRTFKYLKEFMNAELDEDVYEHLDDELVEEIEKLIHTYEERLEIAKRKIYSTLPISPKDQLEYEWLHCPSCNEAMIVVPCSARDVFVECQFCHDNFYLDNCDRCGEVELIDNESHEVYICDNCREWARDHF